MVRQMVDELYKPGETVPKDGAVECTQYPGSVDHVKKGTTACARRAEERAVDVGKSGKGLRAVTGAAETMQYGFFTALRDREHRPNVVRASVSSRAV